jgi:hypothetical protein
VLNLEAEGAEAGTFVCEKKTGSPNRDRSINILSDMYAKYACNLEKSGMVDKHPNVSFKDWIDECVSQDIYSSAKSARRGVNPIIDKGRVQLDGTGEFVYPSELFDKYCI